MDEHTPHITSFVIRFVHPEHPGLPGEPEMRGTILHVQTDEQIPFTHWEDAVEFIRRFVPLSGDRMPSNEDH